MKRSILIIACCFTLLSCKESSTSEVVVTDSPVVEQNAVATSQTIPLKDSSTVLFWEKLPVRSVAELILTDSIRPTTRPVVYSMLDSLSSDDRQSRQFYVRVFNKIMNKADGELAESIGGYALTYVQNYPKEFVETSQVFSKNQLEAWASNIGIEIFLASGENENVKEAFDQVVIIFNDNCKSCNTSHRNRLKSFTQLIWRTIQENQAGKR